MEKLPMCRICLAENVRMLIVVNRNLHKLYEKLTNNPFVTEDRRPMLACFFCSAKLKQCYRFLRNCLIAEELYAQILNKDYQPNPLINPDNLEIFGGFVKTATENISIVDVGRIERIAIKDDLPDVCEGLDEIIEPKEVHQSDELERENLNNSCLDVADIPQHHSESNLEDELPLITFKTAVEEEQEVFKKKRGARETKRANVAKKPKLDTRRTKQDAKTTEPSKKEKSNSIIIQTTQKRTSKPGTHFIKPYKYDQRNLHGVKQSIQPTRRQIVHKPKCDVCQRSFSRKGFLTNHIRIHTREKLFKCDVCQRSFSRKGLLTNHIRIHTRKKLYKCDECQRSFSRKGLLINHIRIHTREKPYKCDVCQRSFTEKGALTRHILLHTGEKRYKCYVCRRSFRCKDTLTKHSRIHTGEKPYKCDVCQRSFSIKGNLTKHIRIHTGEKPYKCDVCQHSFSEKGNLTKHYILIHSGENPYKCEICLKSFSDSSALEVHLLVHM